MLHADLLGATYDALIRGNLQQAVAEAFRVVEVRVRDAAVLEGSYGIELIDVTEPLEAANHAPSAHRFTGRA